MEPYVSTDGSNPITTAPDSVNSPFAGNPRMKIFFILFNKLKTLVQHLRSISVFTFSQHTRKVFLH